MKRDRVLHNQINPNVVLAALPPGGPMRKLGDIVKAVGRGKAAVKRHLDALVKQGLCKAGSNGHGERLWKRN